MCISMMLLAQTRHRQDSTMLCRQDTACISTMMLVQTRHLCVHTCSMMLVVQTQMYADDCRPTSPIAMPLQHHGNVVLTLWCTHTSCTCLQKAVLSCTQLPLTTPTTPTYRMHPSTPMMCTHVYTHTHMYIHTWTCIHL